MGGEGFPFRQRQHYTVRCSLTLDNEVLAVFELDAAPGVGDAVILKRVVVRVAVAVKVEDARSRVVQSPGSTVRVETLWVFGGGAKAERLV